MLMGEFHVVCLLNSLVVTALGLSHLIELALYDDERRIRGVHDDIISPRVTFSNQTFLSWIIYDLVHVIQLFGQLGTSVQLVHHGAFIFVSCVCGYTGFFPISFGWLGLSEGSTPFLMMRWLLINNGRADGQLMVWTNRLF